VTAKKAYADFLRALLAWLPAQVGDDAGLLFMIRGAEISPKNDYDYTVKFPGRSTDRRKAYLYFARNTNDPKSKVFAVDFSIGSKLTYGWLKAEANRMLPEGSCDKYNYGKGDIFFVQTEWGQEGEWDRLYSRPVRMRLCQYARDALRFAKRALDHEASL